LGKVNRPADIAVSITRMAQWCGVTVVVVVVDDDENPLIME